MTECSDLKLFFRLRDDAYQNGGREVMEYLKQGGDPNLGRTINWNTNGGGRIVTTLLSMCVHAKNRPLAKMLVEAKADVNWRDSANQSLLAHCGSPGAHEMANFLIRKGLKLSEQEEVATPGRSITYSAHFFTHRSAYFLFQRRKERCERICLILLNRRLGIGALSPDLRRAWVEGFMWKTRYNSVWGNPKERMPPGFEDED